MEDFSVTCDIIALCGPFCMQHYLKEHTSSPHFAEQKVEGCNSWSKCGQLICVRTDLSQVPQFAHIAARLHFRFLVTLVLVKVAQE